MHAASAAAPPARRPAGLRLATFAAAAVAGLGLLVSLAGCSGKGPAPLLLAPMIHGVDLCQPNADGSSTRTEDELAAYCLASGKSPAAIIESTLSELGPPISADGRFELGYTLPVPLLKLLTASDSGWQVDQRAVERLAIAVKEAKRPVVLHLFSTHFGIGAPIEEELAANPANLAVSSLGPMSKDRYYSIDIYPWTIASRDTDITRFRQMAIGRFIDAVCSLPPDARSRIRAVTLLGEVHHFHADFERGMGLGGPYVVSDYSEASIAGFRAFLAARFGDIGTLNEALGSRFASFAEIEPPAHDIRADRSRRLTEHLDSAAHGKLPLAGWAFDPTGRQPGPVWIRIYRNGALIARVPARYGRQDVLVAKPAFGTADVGWRFDMDFTQLAHGRYRLDFLAERAGGTLASLGYRQVTITAPGETATLIPSAAELPEAADASEIEGSIDHPQDQATVYFNPLAPLWHEFRNAQVVGYLAHFERQVRGSCLGDVPLYTHQIAPFVNPGWDTTKFAVDASLTEAGTLKLGISLYGEATYGHSFLDWLGSTRHRTYGITEFHPLRAMPPGDIEATLERHRQRGATFVSFFVDARPRGVRDPSRRNMFAIDPDNPDFGSDQLYASIRAVLNE